MEINYNIKFLDLKNNNWRENCQIVDTIPFVENRQRYDIETEKSPIEVRCIFPNLNWVGKCEYLKAGKEGFPQTCSQGGVLATFEESIEIWDNLKIDSVPIGNVLKNSIISDLD